MGNLFDNLIKQKNISPANICNKDGSNPLHFMLLSRRRGNSSLAVLSRLSKSYPSWMTMKNQNGHIPLYLAIKNKDINSFYILCQHMIENGFGIKMHLRSKQFVEAMIEFGSKLLKFDYSLELRLLLSTFDYSEIFVWSSKPNEFDPFAKSEDISLIKNVSSQYHKNTIEEILFKRGLVDEKYINQCVVVKEEPEKNMSLILDREHTIKREASEKEEEEEKEKKDRNDEAQEEEE